MASGVLFLFRMCTVVVIFHLRAFRWLSLIYDSPGNLNLAHLRQDEPELLVVIRR